MSASLSVSPTIVVMAKAPIAGRVKTRCSPPCSPPQAARLAAAALADTLEVARRAGAGRCVLAFDGHPGAWLPDGFDVIEQVGDGLGERLDRAFTDIGGPTLLIGMDTPHVAAEQLRRGVDCLAAGAEAVVGLAHDGGFWAVGLQRPWPGLFAAVPMSRPDTGRRLLAALADRELSWTSLPMLTDVDDFATATAVAARFPGSRFAAAVQGIVASLAAPVAALS